MADRDSPRYSDFSSVDKKKSDGLMFDALRSKQFEFVLELLEIGVPLDIKNEVGVAFHQGNDVMHLLCYLPPGKWLMEY